MMINGQEKLACKTMVVNEIRKHGQIVVQPLRQLPVLRDLVVEMEPFWRKVKQITPWLVSSDVFPPASQPQPVRHLPVRQAGAGGRQVPEATVKVTQDTSLALSSVTRRVGAREYAFDLLAKDLHNVDACIMCGACLSACNSHEVSPGFLGPAALAKAYRFVADPRDGARDQRLRDLDGENGVWDCTRCNFCVEVCPKDVKPMEAIIRLRRASIQNGLSGTIGARHITAFMEVVKAEGRLNEGLLPIKMLWKQPGRLFRTFPLALKMFIRGKLPFPYQPPIKGIKAVRQIFDVRQRATHVKSTKILKD
jgi:succinate dehydrogenase / fumarate reductase iron-sulfur subunit